MGAVAHIQTGDGKARPVVLGLIDKQGAFVLYLDETAPSRYYRFSDESDLVGKLVRVNGNQARTIESLKARLASGDGIHLIDGAANAKTIAALYDMPVTTVQHRLRVSGLDRHVPEGKQSFYYDLADVALHFKTLDGGHKNE